jgi:peptidoglycan-associated lipoprotein
MKNMSLKTLTMILALACLVATGCRKKPAGITPIPNSKAGAVGSAGEMPSGGILGGGEGTGGTGLGGSELHPTAMGAGHVGWNANTEALKAETVYFDYDSATVKASEQSKVASVASYLKSNGSAAVRVEGNADERGTEEYNRALGERRALAIREALIQAGIAADRVDTLSNGEDKPAEAGHNAAAWDKNRRGDFIVLTAP